MIPGSRYLVVPVIGALAVLGCESAPLGTPGEGPDVAANHGGSHRGGSGGGGGAGGTATFDLMMANGLVGTALGIELLDDRKQSIWAPFDGMVWNALLTQAAAEQERTNPELADVCEFSPGATDADKQELVSWFTAGNVFGSMKVDKREGRGNILAGPDGVWMSLGKDNNTTGKEDARAYVDSSGTDWNEASSTRVFVFSGGRFVLGLPEAGLRCENQGDVVVATLVPAN